MKYLNLTRTSYFFSEITAIIHQDEYEPAQNLR
jgi:hypothetical protein